MIKKRVYCFIDGFNLFHSLDDLRPKNNRLKWLNLLDLTKAFIIPSREEIKAVYYFSAFATWNQGAYKIHSSYVDALKHFGVLPIIGKFKKKELRCRADCKKSWTTHEEKESDVNIALHMLHNAHLNNYDKAIIITADSDLCPAINIILQNFKNKEVMILTPPNRYCIARELRQTVITRKIKINHLKRSLLPSEIYDNKHNLIATIPEKYNK